MIICTQSSNHIIYVYTKFFFLFFFLCSCIDHYSAETDTITTGHWIRYNNGDTLTSAGGIFQLGFFTPHGNPKRNEKIYIGIWYCKDPKTVVWVANRDSPLLDYTGVFTIDDDGEIMVMDEKKKKYFHTEVRNSQPPSSRTVKLWDNGNLVLTGESEKILWESFENPTDTFLPGMKMGKSLKLTSWRSRDDPANGKFVFGQDPDEENGYTILNGSTLYWRSGGSRGFTPSEMYLSAAFLLINFNKVIDRRDRNNISHYVPLNPHFNNTRLLMNSSGEVQYFTWNDTKEGKGWEFIWGQPQNSCSIYNACGHFGSCSADKEPRCRCLEEHFEAASPYNWENGDYSSGCIRKFDLCGNQTKHKFLKFKVSKIGNPSLFHKAESDKECNKYCLGNCSCQAYSYSNESRRDGRESGVGCWIWTSELIDIQEEYTADRRNLSVQISVSKSSIPGVSIGAGNTTQSEGSQHEPRSLPLKFVIIFTIVTAVVLLLYSISYIYHKRMVTRRQDSRESIHGNPVLHLYDNQRRRDLIDQTQFTEDDKKSIDVPFFNLESILVVTDNFSDENKLGQGGFGPVYKGKFPGGQEIAVKRLSSHSVQGLEELKNEVMLIAKLQHRNLVRLLGYCIERDEKILLYEYMPNKSLDAFIFDRTLCILLDWGKRFDIILGIARGLLYLHQDSRLRVIHRDLKASNILLDEDMNPKISDFGLARIVGGRETEASTNRVVGTYGYMSPEYALDGLFSIKSDVFSFGVVVLEIISGKRNTGFYESQQALNLLGYAWSLWKEERALVLMDHTLAESCNKSEVLKCIIVGLLCVQEDPEDRPTMSNVVFMLGSETETLPNPKQPAFVARKRLSSTPSSSSSKPEMLSINNLTISIPEGR